MMLGYVQMEWLNENQEVVFVYSLVKFFITSQCLKDKYCCCFLIAKVKRRVTEDRKRLLSSWKRARKGDDQVKFRPGRQSYENTVGIFPLFPPAEMQQKVLCTTVQNSVQNRSTQLSLVLPFEDRKKSWFSWSFQWSFSLTIALSQDNLLRISLKWRKKSLN